MWIAYELPVTHPQFRNFPERGLWGARGICPVFRLSGPESKAISTTNGSWMAAVNLRALLILPV
jgi:hypothetical protein